MTHLVVGTDSVGTSERLAAYLTEAITPGDEVFALNSRVGGDETNTEDIEAGADALEALVSGIDGDVAVEHHQFVRGNEPVEDLLAAADEWNTDEFVVGIRKRSPVGKMVFGSTAQNLLLEADRPVRCVPLVSN